MVEPPTMTLYNLEDLPEKLFARGALEKNLLPPCPFIVETGRHRDALYAETHYKIEKIRHLIGGDAVIKGAVDGYAKSLSPNGTDGIHRDIKNPLATHGRIVAFLVTVQVNREGQIW
jgi:hypothetical protein